MYPQEQIFCEVGLLHARILRNRKELALAKRIAMEYVEKLRLLDDSFVIKPGRDISDLQPPADKVAVATGASAPPSSHVHSENMREVLTLIIVLEQEERDLQDTLRARGKLILDEYEKMLRGDSTLLPLSPGHR